MAQRRMFAKSVIETDNFMDLPATTQMLYLHLCMNADDDGFIPNINSIRRATGTTPEDQQKLLDTGYLLTVDGITAIRHWKQSNWIRTDRYTPTEYQAAKKSYISVATGYIRWSRGHRGRRCQKKRYVK